MHDVCCWFQVVLSVLLRPISSSLGLVDVKDFIDQVKERGGRIEPLTSKDRKNGWNVLQLHVQNHRFRYGQTANRPQFKGVQWISFYL